MTRLMNGTLCDTMYKNNIKMRDNHTRRSDIEVDWLDVPFEEIDQVKQLGGRFDGYRRLWYVPSHIDHNGFDLWKPSARIYLESSFEDKGEIKQLGGRFDREKGKWFIRSDMDRKGFARWLSLRLK